MKNTPLLYILIGAILVFLLWQFIRVRTDLVHVRADLSLCQDSLYAIQRDTVRDTTWQIVYETDFIEAPVPDPITIVDTYFVQPSFSRYQDSLMLDTSLTLYYRLNVQGRLLSQGYRYKATRPTIHTKEIVYLPGDCPRAPSLTISVGTLVRIPTGDIGLVGFGTHRRTSFGYSFDTGKSHSIYFLYRL